MGKKNKGKNMQTELAFKKEVSSLLDNQLITSLIRDKRYNIDDNTWITIEGELEFLVKMDGERLIIQMKNILPKLTAKRFLRFEGRVNSISIGKEDVLVVLDGLPDQILKLVDEV